MLKKIIFILTILSFSSVAQEIVWEEITSQYDMPDGVKVFKGTREDPKLNVFYLDVDMNVDSLVVRPYIAPKSNLKEFTNNVGAYAAVNSGFFGGDASFSTVVYPGEVKASNVTALTRNSKSYPVTRSMFSINNNGDFSIDWIYHHGGLVEDIYSYDSPMPYSNNDPNPLPPPTKSTGTVMDDLLIGMGGAPTLVKGGFPKVTYDEEIMWGSGVGLSNGDPRTAVGYTAAKHIIMLVADGRQTESVGVSLTELASIMINLGCVEAMNLDGGGSSQMAIPGEYINNPSEQRAVPTILAITHKDSLGLPQDIQYEDVIDTGDDRAIENGSGWFPTANEGYFGGTPSLLNQAGDGMNYYEFIPNLKTPAEYEVYGWWVASTNRTKDTPFIINHAGMIDTVRMDQSTNGSSWQLVGTFQFDGSEGESVIISNAATTETFVVADAMRFVTYDTSLVTSINEIEMTSAAPDGYELKQNYPNPFNPSTAIEFNLIRNDIVDFKVNNLIGQTVFELNDIYYSAGSHTIPFNGLNLSSGIYFYTISTSYFSKTKAMHLLK